MTNHHQAKHVCILGCGRSGTSIFGELFQSLPQYRYYSEPEWAEFKQIDFSTPVAVKVPRPAPATSAPAITRYLQDLMKFFPSSGIIFWQVRHPLDTICSLRVGISRNWGHHPRPPDHLEWLHRPLPERCAHHWNYINTAGYRQVQGLAVVNRFEDMVRNPFETALAQAKRANVDISGSLQQLKRWASRVQDQNNQQFQEAECSRPYSINDHKKKVGRWKENLTQQEIAQVLPIISEGSALLGYRVKQFKS